MAHRLPPSRRTHVGLACSAKNGFWLGRRSRRVVIAEVEQGRAHGAVARAAAGKDKAYDQLRKIDRTGAEMKGPKPLLIPTRLLRTG